MHRKAFLIASASAVLTGCGHRGVAPSTWQDIAGDGEPFKSAFNRDAGKVRILMLLSPT